ncbi:hypothetical protein [Methanobacterium spitsbergense]|uniref:Uncharacterized protein n=1 Tax=Methanobacterium spitsbergense TaxID=2874285 RepID=A0A8T5V5H6_9EURY|nr:hypothetical protein [Methanobacterium spitsbergense]MBZ2167131.1 hypothetical protein [Methanobacterium spitsbergense]
MLTTVKFFQDHEHRNPISFSNASNKIIAHLLKMLSKTLEDAVLYNHELKLFIDLIGIIDLMTLNYITELIIGYQEKKMNRILRMLRIKLMN